MEGLDELRGIGGLAAVRYLEGIEVQIAGKKRESRAAEQFHFLNLVGRKRFFYEHEIDEFLFDPASKFRSDGGFGVFFRNRRILWKRRFRKRRHAFETFVVRTVLAEIEEHRIGKERVQAFFRAGSLRVDREVGKVGGGGENSHGIIVRINGSAGNRIFYGNGLLAVGQSAVIVVFEHRVFERGPNDEKRVREKGVRDNLDPVGTGNESENAVEDVAEVVFHRFRRFRVSNPPSPQGP